MKKLMSCVALSCLAFCAVASAEVVTYHVTSTPIAAVVTDGVITYPSATTVTYPVYTTVNNTDYYCFEAAPTTIPATATFKPVMYSYVVGTTKSQVYCYLPSDISPYVTITK